MLQLLPDTQHYTTLTASHEPFMIFKHSTRCSISDHACREVYETIEKLNLEHIYLIDVITQRDLSQHIAQDCGIHHESPQLLFFDATGNVYAHASHGQVNERHIRHVLG
jgi:bacillithiol system protein YtxJ